MLQIGHHTAGPGMRSKTITQEQPHSPRKSRWEHWLNGNGEGWTPQEGAASIPSSGSPAQQCHPGWDELGRAALQRWVQARSPAGSWPPRSPTAAGCQDGVQVQGTRWSSTRSGGGVGHRAAGAAHAAVAQGPEQPSGSSTGREGAAQLQPLAPVVGSCCCPEARLMWDPLKQFLSGLDSHVAKALLRRPVLSATPSW